MKTKIVKIKDIEEEGSLEEGESKGIRIPYRGKTGAVISCDPYQYILTTCPPSGCEYSRGYPSGNRTFHRSPEDAIEDFYQTCLRRGWRECKSLEEVVPALREIRDYFIKGPLHKLMKNITDSAELMFKK
jgi:hypothetical protein